MKTQGTTQCALRGEAFASEIKSENYKAETFSCAADYGDRISVGSFSGDHNALEDVNRRPSGRQYLTYPYHVPSLARAWDVLGISLGTEYLIAD